MLKNSKWRSRADNPCSSSSENDEYSDPLEVAASAEYWKTMVLYHMHLTRVCQRKLGFINSVDKTQLSRYTSHRRSTTVSLETYPSMSEKLYIFNKDTVEFRK